jgi:hypothetical protein
MPSVAGRLRGFKIPSPLWCFLIVTFPGTYPQACRLHSPRPANHLQAFEITGESPVNFRSISPDFPKSHLDNPLKSLAEKKSFTPFAAGGIVWSLPAV